MSSFSIYTSWYDASFFILLSLGMIRRCFHIFNTRTKHSVTKKVWKTIRRTIKLLSTVAKGRGDWARHHSSEGDAEISDKSLHTKVGRLERKTRQKDNITAWVCWNTFFFKPLNILNGLHFFVFLFYLENIGTKYGSCYCMLPTERLSIDFKEVNIFFVHHSSVTIPARLDSLVTWTLRID